MAHHDHSALHAAKTSLVCGEHGDHDGEVIGCCHICGLLLCRGHANYLPSRSMGGVRRLHEFGMVGNHEAAPLVCGDHASPFAAVAGVPSGGAVKRGWWERIVRRVWVPVRVALRPKRSSRTRRQPPPAHSRRG